MTRKRKGTEEEKHNEKDEKEIEKEKKKIREDEDEDKEENKEEEKEKTNWTQQKHSKEPQKNLAGECGKDESAAHVALLVVDVINDLDFAGNTKIFFL